MCIRDRYPVLRPTWPYSALHGDLGRLRVGCQQRLVSECGVRAARPLQSCARRDVVKQRLGHPQLPGIWCTEASTRRCVLREVKPSALRGAVSTLRSLLGTPSRRKRDLPRPSRHIARAYGAGSKEMADLAEGFGREINVRRRSSEVRPPRARTTPSLGLGQVGVAPRLGVRCSLAAYASLPVGDPRRRPIDAAQESPL